MLILQTSSMKLLYLLLVGVGYIVHPNITRFLQSEIVHGSQLHINLWSVAGGETVAREDVMEAIERAKFGINGKQLRPSTISKELGKMFPWMPSLMGKNTRQDGVQGPLGYQTLS